MSTNSCVLTNIRLDLGKKAYEYTLQLKCCGTILVPTTGAIQPGNKYTVAANDTKPVPFTSIPLPGIAAPKTAAAAAAPSTNSVTLNFVMAMEKKGDAGPPKLYDKTCAVPIKASSQPQQYTVLLGKVGSVTFTGDSMDDSERLKREAEEVRRKEAAQREAEERRQRAALREEEEARRRAPDYYPALMRQLEEAEATARQTTLAPQHREHMSYFARTLAPVMQVTWDTFSRHEGLRRQEDTEFGALMQRQREEHYRRYVHAELRIAKLHVLDPDIEVMREEAAKRPQQQQQQQQTRGGRKWTYNSDFDASMSPDRRLRDVSLELSPSQEQQSSSPSSPYCGLSDLEETATRAAAARRLDDALIIEQSLQRRNNRSIDDDLVLNFDNAGVSDSAPPHPTTTTNNNNSRQQEQQEQQQLPPDDVRTLWATVNRRPPPVLRAGSDPRKIWQRHTREAVAERERRRALRRASPTYNSDFDESSSSGSDLDSPPHFQERAVSATAGAASTSPTTTITTRAARRATTTTTASNSNILDDFAEVDDPLLVGSNNFSPTRQQQQQQHFSSPSSSVKFLVTPITHASAAAAPPPPPVLPPPRSTVTFKFEPSTLNETKFFEFSYDRQQREAARLRSTTSSMIDVDDPYASPMQSRRRSISMAAASPSRAATTSPQSAATAAVAAAAARNRNPLRPFNKAEKEIMRQRALDEAVKMMISEQQQQQHQQHDASSSLRQVSFGDSRNVNQSTSLNINSGNLASSMKDAGNKSARHSFQRLARLQLQKGQEQQQQLNSSGVLSMSMSARRKREMDELDRAFREQQTRLEMELPAAPPLMTALLHLHNRNPTVDEQQRRKEEEEARLLLFGAQGAAVSVSAEQGIVISPPLQRMKASAASKHSNHDKNGSNAVSPYRDPLQRGGASPSSIAALAQSRIVPLVYDTKGNEYCSAVARHDARSQPSRVHFSPSSSSASHHHHQHLRSNNNNYYDSGGRQQPAAFEDPNVGIADHLSRNAVLSPTMIKARRASGMMMSAPSSGGHEKSAASSGGGGGAGGSISIMVGGQRLKSTATNEADAAASVAEMQQQQQRMVPPASGVVHNAAAAYWAAMAARKGQRLVGVRVPLPAAAEYEHAAARQIAHEVSPPMRVAVSVPNHSYAKMFMNQLPPAAPRNLRATRSSPARDSLGRFVAASAGTAAPIVAGQSDHLGRPVPMMTMMSNGSTSSGSTFSSPLAPLLQETMRDVQEMIASIAASSSPSSRRRFFTAEDFQEL